MKTPADELRQAAQHIRDTAASATPGPWWNLDNGDRIVQSFETAPPEVINYVVDEPLIANPANADHIVLFDPVVADIVADLLVAIANMPEPLQINVIQTRMDALALARALNERSGQ